MKKYIFMIMSIFLLVSVVGCTNQNENVNNVNEEVEESVDSAWPRTIIDAGGNEVYLEEEPERIAILHSLYLEYFFALDTPPAASAGASTGDAMQALESWETLEPYVETTDDIIDLGSAREINLEAILASEPDVIVTFVGQGGLDAVYDQLNQIAPVVLIDFSDTWQDQTRAAAEVVGKEELAEELIAETEEVIATSKEILEGYSDKTLAIFRTQEKNFVTRGTSEYYDTFGIKQPNNYPDEYETMSLEAVATMNPDYIVFQDTVETIDAFIATLDDSSVWNSLDAVQNGRVYYFDDSLNTLGPLSMRLTAEKFVEIYTAE